ncbi:MAG: ABC transporter ATP-binding protein [Armatimonadota bacterium]|nr:ABC transporter ATP-binding protein [Armatimonadota bacterium]
MALATEAVIETRSLSKHYGRVRAVDGLDLSVPRGSLFGFLGPNGAGKSTTIRMLTGLVRPSSGEARLLGVPLGERLRVGRRVGALVETPAFYPHLTAWQNLRLLASLSGGAQEEELQGALEGVGLREAAHRKVSTFSHGMRQRLGIAQALVPRPELLILDEPASGLDPEGLAEVRRMLVELQEEGITVFLSSHLLSEVEQTCTHVAVIMNGQVIARGEVGGMLEGARPRTRFVVDDPARALAALEGVADIDAEVIDDRTMEAAADELTSADINEMLVKAGVRVHELTPARRSLESFYMEAVREWQGGAAGEGRGPAPELDGGIQGSKGTGMA